MCQGLFPLVPDVFVCNAYGHLNVMNGTRIQLDATGLVWHFTLPLRMCVCVNVLCCVLCKYFEKEYRYFTLCGICLALALLFPGKYLYVNLC